MLSSLVLGELGVRLLRWTGNWALLVASTRVLVEGDSMVPALSDGDRLLVSRVAYHLAAPAHGDIVLLRDPARPGSECIKRILALPGELVRLDGLVASVSVAGAGGTEGADATWQLGAQDYFVVGDNFARSTDSLSYGPIDRSAIIGRAWYRYGSTLGRTGPL